MGIICCVIYDAPGVVHASIYKKKFLRLEKFKSVGESGKWFWTFLVFDEFSLVNFLVEICENFELVGDLAIFLFTSKAKYPLNFKKVIERLLQNLSIFLQNLYFFYVVFVRNFLMFFQNSVIKLDQVMNKDHFVIGYSKVVL